MVLTCAFFKQPDGGIQILDLQVLAQVKSFLRLRRNIPLIDVRLAAGHRCKGRLQATSRACRE
jgi:hypothetical protein